jgi:hypothetical protein
LAEHSKSRRGDKVRERRWRLAATLARLGLIALDRIFSNSRLFELVLNEPDDGAGNEGMAFRTFFRLLSLLL